MARTKASIKNEIHYLKQDRRDCKNYLSKWGNNEYYKNIIDYCDKRIKLLEEVLINKK
jgi:hypothetical protein